MNIKLCPAFILHQRPYRENSLLLDIFSEQFGRISLVARGSRQNKRGQSGLLQLYQPLLLSWYGQKELCTLTACEADGPRFILKAESALCGLYLNELLVRFLPITEIDSSRLFNNYKQALDALQSANHNEITLRLFEKYLLNYLGYALVLDHEVETGRLIDDQQRYYYQPDSGLYRWRQGLSQPSISGRSLQHLIDEQGFDKTSLNEIKHVMRTVINFYLGGKELQSRQLFGQLQQYSAK